MIYSYLASSTFTAKKPSSFQVIKNVYYRGDYYFLKIIIYARLPQKEKRRWI